MIRRNEQPPHSATMGVFKMFALRKPGYHYKEFSDEYRSQVGAIIKHQ